MTATGRLPIACDTRAVQGRTATSTMTTAIEADVVSAPLASEGRRRAASGEASGASQPAGINVSSGQRRRARARMMFASRRSSLSPNALSIAGRIDRGAGEPEGLQPITRSGGRAGPPAGAPAARRPGAASRALSRRLNQLQDKSARARPASTGPLLTRHPPRARPILTAPPGGTRPRRSRPGRGVRERVPGGALGCGADR
jgi:hypothetical protein